jgi:hypothetical protein
MFAVSVCRLVSRRCRDISAMRRFASRHGAVGLGVLYHPAPGPSLSPWNRGASPAPCRLRACGFCRSAELVAHRHKGGHADGVKRAGMVVTDFSPLGVGPCFTRALSRAATRNADHAVPGVTARMGGSDFHASPPASSLLHLFAGARFLRTDARKLSPTGLVTACSRSQAPHGQAPHGQARHGLGPRGVSLPLAVARHGLLPTGGSKPSALTNQNFRGSTPSGSASPVTFAPRLLISRSIDAPVTSRAARLDTGLAAHDYPGGTRTR